MSIIVKEIVVKTTIEQNIQATNNDELFEKIKRAVLKEINKDQSKQKVSKKDR